MGPEVLLKALARLGPQAGFESRIFGASGYLARLASDLGLRVDFGRHQVVEVTDFPYPPRWGTVGTEAGALAAASLQQATRFCRDEGLPLLVTPPVNKAALHLAGIRLPGQTELVASEWPGARPAMAFFSDRFHLLLATVHIPLNDVSRALTAPLLEYKCRLFHAALERLLDREPRIAVCGVNPHASEGGLFGDEESRIVQPVLERLEAEGLRGFAGPFPADTIFRQVASGEFDGAVAHYHDQGLIPLKLLAFDSAVNTTLGLPIVRTSPDHGSAFPIAGQGVADPASMLAAISWGRRLTG